MTRRLSRLGILILAAALSLSVSCATTRPPVETGFADKPSSDWTETALAQARGLVDRGACEEAAAVLRSMGEDESALARMDEVLYLLGTARLGMNDPVRAARCFALLREYYPRCEHEFPDLTKAEEQCNRALASIGSLPLWEAEAPASAVAGAGSIGQGGAGNSAGDGPLVTNVFYDTDIRQALMDISAQTGVSLVPDAMVHGFVTAELRDVPLESALERLLAPLGLAFQKIDDYYLIGAPVQDNPSYPLLTETRQIKPLHRSAEEVSRMLPRFYADLCRVDRETNTLTITATRNVLEALEEHLAALDRQTPQVMIDAMVVEMTSNVTRNLGLDWYWKNSEGNETLRFSKLPPASFDSLFVGEFLKVKPPLDLRVALRAMAAKGMVNVRANPRVATVEGHQAEIRIAREACFSLLPGSVTFSYFTLEKIATGITLKITPYVGASAQITSDISTEVSDVVATGSNDMPVTSVRSVNTRIGVTNGESIAIGGLRSQNERKTENRVPYLGEIPLLGRLFGHTVTEKVETEVLILITPYLMIPQEEFDRL